MTSLWTASQGRLLLGAGALAGHGARASRLKEHMIRVVPSVTSFSLVSTIGVGFYVGWLDLKESTVERSSSATSRSAFNWFASGRSFTWAEAAQRVCDQLYDNALHRGDEPDELQSEKEGSVEAKDFTVGRFPFKDFKVLGGKRLKAHGCCHLKYYGWEVCAAVLYVPEHVETPLSGSDVTDPSLPKMLELRYCRSFPREQFGWVTRWAMSRNGHKFDEAEEAKVKAFNSLYRDVSFGDCYTLGYDPTTGEGGRVTLQLNGRELGAVEGAHVSEAIFSVWFGKHPFLDHMKQELLRPAL